MTARPQLLLTLLLAACGIVITTLIILYPPQADQADNATQAVAPAIQFIQVVPQRIRLDVRSQGRVTAQTEIDLVSGVSGNIIKLSQHFVSGGFFNKGDLLVSIDPAEYDLRIAQAQARVTDAQYQLSKEQAEAAQAKEEWQHLGQGAPNPLSLRIPQLKEKKAKLAAEQEELKNAKLLRQRTEIRAPFDGRVRSHGVGIGQYVGSGTILGQIYNSDVAEVRLPLSTQELAFIDFADTPVTKKQRIPVTLLADYLGQKQSWQGHIARSEGVIDKETGKTMIVAQILDPLRLKRTKHLPNDENPSASLPMGLYVEAQIPGRWQEQVIALPTAAVFKDREVGIITENNRLQIRPVEVLRKERDQVIIKTGLEAGDKVLVSGLQHLIEGLEVTPHEYQP